MLVEDQGRVCRTYAFIATDSRLKTTFGGLFLGHGKKQCDSRCAEWVGQYNLKAPCRVLVTQDSTDSREAKVFRAHAAPQGMCDNLMNALKLLAHKHKYGDSPVKMVVQGLQERSRLKITSGIKSFIMVDNHEVVKVGDLGKNMESKEVVEPNFTTDFPGKPWFGNER